MSSFDLLSRLLVNLLFASFENNSSRVGGTHQCGSSVSLNLG